MVTPNVFTEGSVPEILAAARSEITAELRRELESWKTAAAQQAAHDEEMLVAERRARADEEAMRVALEAQAAAEARERDELIAARAESSPRGSPGCSSLPPRRSSASRASPPPMPCCRALVTSKVPALAFLAIVSVTVFGILNGVFGTNLADLRERLQRVIARRVADWQRRTPRP